MPEDFLFTHCSDVYGTIFLIKEIPKHKKEITGKLFSSQFGTRVTTEDCCSFFIPYTNMRCIRIEKVPGIERI